MQESAAFKICFILSALTHFTLLGPWSSMRFAARPEITFQKVELTYFRTGGDDMIVKDINPITSVKKGAVPLKAEPYQTEDTEMKPEKSREIETAGKEAPKSEPETPGAGGGNAIDLGASFNGDSVRDAYCMTVRDRIKRVLEKDRRGFVKDGELQVRFTVERNGALKNVALYKSRGGDTRNLESIALDSVKKAAPFPPFSDDIKEKELPFILPIKFSFK